ncbi:MAG: single-stranded DNA-binding protein [Solibacillus isronensis]
MINRVVLVGRLTKDPELRYTPSGVPMARFTIAVNRTFSNEQGEREADFISCIAWRKQAENLANFMKKGNLIGVEGRIQTGSFEGQDGKRVYTTDVIADSIQFLEKSNSQQSGQGQTQTNQQSSQSYQQPSQQQQQQNYTRVDEDPFASTKGPIEVSEDDLPF